MLSEILEEAQGIKPMAQRGRGQTPGLAHKGGTPGGNPERLSPAPSPPGCPAVPGPMWGRDPSHFTHQSLEKAGPSRCERKSQQSSLETPVPALPFLLPPPLPAAGIRRGPEGQMSYPDLKHGAWGPQTSCSHASSWQAPPCAQVTISSKVAAERSSSLKPCPLSSPCSPTHPYS